MRVLLASGLATLTSLVVFAQGAYGACSFSPTLGDDAFVCDSGTAPSLSDLQGNNRLTLPAGGSGTITGAVTSGLAPTSSPSPQAPSVALSAKATVSTTLS